MLLEHFVSLNFLLMCYIWYIIFFQWNYFMTACVQRGDIAAQSQLQGKWGYRRPFQELLFPNVASIQLCFNLRTFWSTTYHLHVNHTNIWVASWLYFWKTARRLLKSKWCFDCCIFFEYIFFKVIDFAHSPLILIFSSDQRHPVKTAYWTKLSRK